MKIWYGYGSEHSMNLVMIGTFVDATAAAKAKMIIDTLSKQLNEEAAAGKIEAGEYSTRYLDSILELLGTLNVHSIGAVELEQFLYDVQVDLDDNKITIKTDEIDVSAFLKIMLDKGARVEVFSAHDYPIPSV